MKKTLFLISAMAVFVATVATAEQPKSKWYVSSDVYELDGVIHAIGFAGVGTNFALEDGKIMIGDSDGVPAQKDISGDAAITRDGVLTVTNANLAKVRVNDGSGLTNLNGANIASGDIPSARLTTHGVVVTDFTQDSGVLVGTGAGTFEEETGDTLRTSLGLTIGTDVLAPITWTVGAVTSSLSAKVTIESSQTAAQFITGWISEAAGGVGVGTNVTSMVIDSAGVKIAGGGDEDAYGIFTTHTDGTAVFDVTIKVPQEGLFFNVIQNNNVVISQTFDITQD